VKKVSDEFLKRIDQAREEAKRKEEEERIAKQEAEQRAIAQKNATMERAKKLKSELIQKELEIVSGKLGGGKLHSLKKEKCYASYFEVDQQGITYRFAAWIRTRVQVNIEIGCALYVGTSFDLTGELEGSVEDEDAARETLRDLLIECILAYDRDRGQRGVAE
jgi:hypothetical protein